MKRKALALLVLVAGTSFLSIQAASARVADTSIAGAGSSLVQPARPVVGRTARLARSCMT